MQPTPTDAFTELQSPSTAVYTVNHTMTPPVISSLWGGYQVSQSLEGKAHMPQAIALCAENAKSLVRRPIELLPQSNFQPVFSSQPQGSSVKQEQLSEQLQDIQALFDLVDSFSTGNDSSPIEEEFVGLTTDDSLQLSYVPLEERLPETPKSALYPAINNALTAAYLAPHQEIVGAMTECGSLSSDLSFSPDSSVLEGGFVHNDANIRGYNSDMVSSTSLNSKQSVKQELNVKSCSMAITRPKLSYRCLIRQAILAQPEKQAKLQQIYKWISDNYPFYSVENQSCWKNSVRHALSLNKKVFKKSEDKAADKRSSYWTLDDSVQDKSKKHKIKHSTPVEQHQVFIPPPLFYR